MHGCFQNFNSIKVRLEQMFCSMGGVLTSYFNSIKVRLELMVDVLVISNVPYFNSIKVRLELFCGSCSSCGRAFQFHKGTIRTGDGGAVRGGCVNFNSIKVRLEQPRGVPPLGLFVFQFHKGTIRTRERRQQRRLCCAYFNSIKVRLELFFFYGLLSRCNISIP